MSGMKRFLFIFFSLKTVNLLFIPNHWMWHAESRNAKTDLLLIWNIQHSELASCPARHSLCLSNLQWRTGTGVSIPSLGRSGSQQG